MSLRELTPAESAQVSGARLSEREALQGLAAYEMIGKIWVAWTPKYAGKDWKYVVAVEPALNKGMASFLDNIGVGGEATLKAWAHDYA